jgi:phosphate transport system protein
MTGLSNRAHYDRQLQTLQEDLLLLGSMVEKSVQSAVDALRQRDQQLAQQVIDDDERIDDAAHKLEEESLLLIARQQPLATDLRAIAAALFIIGELERIGDYAEGIAKITLRMAFEPPLKPLIDIPRMGTIAIDMLRDSLNAFINRDLAVAETIWRRDDEVDNLYNQVYRELLIYMLNDPKTIERATLLLWAAHNLERIADRVTNICERTVFVITGDSRYLRKHIPESAATHPDIPE